MKSLIQLIFLILFTLIIASNAQDIPRTLYVLNGLGQTVSNMTLESKIINNDIVTVGSVPNRIYAHNNLVYVVNSVPDGLTVIDPLTNQILKNISLTTGSNPWDMGFVGINKAYVSNWLANSISVVDLEEGEEINTIDVGTAPEGILVVDNTAYVCNSGGYPFYTNSSVSIIDVITDSITKTLAILTNPQDLALGPNGNIYVVCTGNYVDIHGKIVEINPFGDLDYTALVTDTIDIGGTPTDIVVTNAGIAYLADFGDDNNGFLYAYDVYNQKVLYNAENPIAVGKGAMALLYDHLSDDLYINNFSDDAVQLLNSENGSVIETYLFGDGVQHMAILEGQPSSLSQDQSLTPVSFALEQNYPNPFNPTTAIGYQLSAASHVDLSIYNLHGQKIATLVKGKKEPGFHQVQWDATGFASGVYLYQLTTESGIRETKRMVLLK